MQRKHLYITAVLYLVFLALAIRGWIDWRRSLESESVVPARVDARHAANWYD